METITRTSREEIQKRLAESRKLGDEIMEYLKIDEKTLMLNEWVTIKHYCRLFEIENIATVTNWISRGIIPPENIQVIERLNNIKLIKAIPYK